MHVGKESTQLAGDGLEGAWRRVKILREPAPDAWTTELLPLLQSRPSAAVAAAVGVNRSTVKHWKVSEQRPRAARLARLRTLLDPSTGRVSR